MKKNLKKRIALLLSIVMVIGMTSTGVVADEATGFTTTTSSDTSDVSTVSDEILTGTAWITVEGIEGGQIQFDYDSGAIVDAEDTITVANIPSEIDGVAVVAIGDRAFAYNYDCLTEVSIPSSVKTIGYYAFEDCNYLTTMNLSEGLESVEPYGFSWLPSLASITIPTSVTYLSYGMFEYSGITEIYYNGTIEEWESISYDVNISGDITIYLADGNVILPTSYWVTVEGIEGGQIKFNSETGTIEDAEDTITVANIPSEIDGVAVVEIGFMAFAQNYYNLIEVSIPSSVKIIGQYAFEDCYALKTVNIADGVEYIDNYAFSWCYSLESIEIPISVEYIGYEVFHDSDMMSEIHYAGTLEEWECVSNVTYLPSDITIYLADGNVILPTTYWVTVEGIEGGQIKFNSETGTIEDAEDTITVANIPSEIDGVAVVAIGEWAFGNCSSLKSISIPQSVSYIGNSAFISCHLLEAIVLPEGIENVEAYTFGDCNLLKTITIPSTVTYVGELSFDYCDSLTTIYYNGTVAQWQSIDGLAYSSISNDVIIVTTDNENYQYAENTDAAYNEYLALCDFLVTLMTVSEEVANTEEEIKEYLISQIETYMQSITTVETYYDMSEEEFYENLDLGTACIFASTVDLFIEDFEAAGNDGAWGSFYFELPTYCSSVIYSMGRGYYCGISSESYDTGDDYEEAAGDWITVEGIEGGQIRFDYDNGVITDAENTITVANIPSEIDGVAVVEIGYGAFGQNYDYLTEVSIPSSVTKINTYAFEDCYVLETINIAEGVEYINPYAFSWCYSLESIEIPISVEYIGYNTFYESNMMREIYYNGTQEEWESISSNANISGDITIYLADDAVILPSAYWITVDGIEGGQIKFNYETGTIEGSENTITMANIPSEIDGVAVVEIAYRAFLDCDELESVTIADGIINIENYAFAYSDNITSITIPSSVEYIGWDAFYYINSLNIYYDGTLGEWASISSDANIAEDVTIYLADGNVILPTTYWVTVDGIEGGQIKFNSVTGTIEDAEDTITVANIPSEINGVAVVAIGDSAFAYNYYNLTEVSIPSSVKSIGTFAFEDCNYLTVMNLSEGLEIVYEYGFAWLPSLTSITIPTSVTYLGGWVFDYSGIREIYYNGTQEEWESISSDANISTDIVVYFTSGETEVDPDTETGTDPDPDTVVIPTVTTEGDTTVNPTIDEETAATVFTEEEIESGAELVVALNVNEVNAEDITVEEQEKIEELISELDYTVDVALVLDIDIVKYVGETATSLTELDEKITITIDIPEEMKVDGKKYVVIRVHDGEAEILEDLDDNPDTITFETDKFSTYAVAITDIDDVIIGDVDDVMIGDVDGNGKVTLIDAMYIAQYINKILTEDDIDLSAADVNNDGKVTLVDAMYIAQYINGIIAELG